MSVPSNRLEFRCFCSEKTLLAVCGRDDHGLLFVHVKVFKQGRVFGEVIAQGGTVRVRCRACTRWHTIVMKDRSVDFKVDTDGISREMLASDMPVSLP